MKKKYSALPELLLQSIFYTLINYVLLSMVLSFRLHWSSILFSAAMLWFALDYSKTIQQLTGKRLLADLLCRITSAKRARKRQRFRLSPLPRCPNRRL